MLSVPVMRGSLPFVCRLLLDCPEGWWLSAVQFCSGCVCACVCFLPVFPFQPVFLTSREHDWADLSVLQQPAGSPWVGGPPAEADEGHLCRQPHHQATFCAISHGKYACTSASAPWGSQPLVGLSSSEQVLWSVIDMWIKSTNVGLGFLDEWRVRVASLIASHCSLLGCAFPHVVCWHWLRRGPRRPTYGAFHLKPQEPVVHSFFFFLRILT